MADVLDRALARQSELETVIASAQDELQRIANFIAMYHALRNATAKDAAAPSPAEVASSAPQESPRKRGPNGSNPEEIAEAATKILYRENRPMTRFELIPLIEAQGLVIGGVDKPRNLGTLLWRSKRFKNTGEGYWPDDGNGPPETVPEDSEEALQALDL